jgi:catalase
MTDDNQARPTTTDSGIPVASDQLWLTVVPDGPVLPQDHYLIEQHVDQGIGERIEKAVRDGRA